MPSLSCSRLPARFVSFLALLMLLLGAVLPASAQKTPQEESECCFYQVAGTVFYDQNANGIRETSEPGLAGWTVEVLDVTNTFVTSTTTDALGNYLFAVPVGCGAVYKLRQVMQSGWTQTLPAANGWHTGTGSGCSAAIHGPYDFGNAQSDCQPLSVTYTLNSEFNLGTLSGVVATTDQLELTPTSTTWPYAWIANAAEGTVSKVDTQTGKEVGRYYTGPADSFNSHAFNNPSRTVVDNDGSCWVANRTMGPWLPSVVQIVTSGGEDRNSDSVINTSMDLNSNGMIDASEILPWGQDERVVRNYLIGSTLGAEARGMVIDKAGFLWVGLTNTQTLHKVSTNLPTSVYAPNLTPTVAPSLVSLFVGANPYGLALSPNGMIYQSCLDTLALQIDPGLASGGTAAGPAVTEKIYHLGTNYGIAVDQNCVVWIALFGGPPPNYDNGCVRWDPPLTLGNPYQGFTFSTGYVSGAGRGICVDYNNDVWMAVNDFVTDKIVKFANTPNPPVIGTYTVTAPTPVGVGVANDGHIIVTPNAGSNWDKVDVTTGNLIPLAGPQLAGFGPYTYSDFTGSQQNLTGTQQGIWSVITDGGSSGIAWNLIAWSPFTPPSTSVQVQARVAQTLPSLSTMSWTTYTVSGPLSVPIPGRYIETRVRLQRDVECGQPFVTPVLYDLTVAAICDSCSFVNCPPDTVVPCMTPEGAEVFYPTPLLNALCDSTYVVSCSPPPGFFPMGPTLVQCIAVNAANDTVRCSFQVIVGGDCDPDPIGSCCVGSTCLVATEAQCDQYNGIYFGDNTHCDDGCDQGCAHPPNNLVGWWPLNSAPGGFTPNLASVSTAGQMLGAPVSSGGMVGGAYGFNGVNQSIRVAHHASLDLGTSDFSADAWVKTSATPGVATILDKRNSGTIQGIVFFLYQGYPGVQLAVGGSWSNYILNAGNGGAAAFVGDDAWHLVAVTVDRDDPAGIRFYVDGAPVGTPFNPTAHAGNLNSTQPLYIAQAHPALGSSHYPGLLDEVEIVRRELTANEVFEIFDAGPGGKCPDLCYASQSVACCNGLTSSSSITICNYSLVPHLYSWGLSGTTGAGCTGPGPASFSPPSGSVTVPAQSCVTIPVTIACPTGINVGEHACYYLSVYNHDTGRMFGCTGSVRRTNRWCWKWGELDPVPVEAILPVTAGTAFTLHLQVGVSEGLPGPASADFLIEPVAGHEGLPSEALSLAGLPPGATLLSNVVLNPGESTEIPVEVLYTDAYAIGYDRLRVSADESGSGVFTPVAETALRSVSGEVLGHEAGPGDDLGGPGDRLLLLVPNPFTPSNQIRFRVDGAQPQPVRLRVYQLNGGSVKIFYNKTPLAPGEHTLTWDGKDDRGMPLATGVYFLRLEVGDRTESVKILVRR